MVDEDKWRWEERELCETESRRRKQKEEQTEHQHQEKMNNINVRMAERQKKLNKTEQGAMREGENKFFPQLGNQSNSARLISF